MENIFLVSEEEVMDNFKKQNPTKEDYNDIICESDPEFLIKDYSSLRSSWDDNDNQIKPESVCDDDDDFEEEIDRYSVKLPCGYEEIELYDHQKTFDENFEVGKDRKYILIEVDSNKNLGIKNPNDVLPSPQSKCLVDIEKIEDYSLLQFIPIDYDTFWGLRFLTFIKYNSDFFLCDERVMFEGILIKYKGFGYKPFYWSKEVIFDEVGIKKDRATKIIERFISLGIITKKLIKTTLNNRPMQINYYDINPDKIIELIPKIYEERDDIDIENQVKKHLFPALKKQ